MAGCTFLWIVPTSPHNVRIRTEDGVRARHTWETPDFMLDRLRRHDLPTQWSDDVPPRVAGLAK
eukprot:4334133-Alexandrium_andersonii.AAC.1